MSLQYKTITGRFRDVYIDVATGEQRSRPTEGQIRIRPSVKDILFEGELINLDEHTWPRIVQMQDGTFTADLIVTDQPGINPTAWTYNVKPSWTNLEVNLSITSDMPDIIDIDDLLPLPESGGVIITKGDPGRGIESMEAVGNILTVYYTDGGTDTIEIPIIDAGGVTIKYNYVHTQMNPSEIWTVQHNLNRVISSVRVNLGTPGSEEYGDLQLCPWEEIDLNTIKVYVGAFGSNTSGRAIIA